MYWPENVDAPVEYGDITVTLTEVERFGDYVQRTLNIRHSVSIVQTLSASRTGGGTFLCQDLVW